MKSARAFPLALLGLHFVAASVSAAPAPIGQSSAPANTSQATVSSAARPGAVVSPGVVASHRPATVTVSSAPAFLGGSRAPGNVAVLPTVRPPLIVRPTALPPLRMGTATRVGSPISGTGMSRRQPGTDPTIPGRVAPMAPPSVGTDPGVASAAARTPPANPARWRHWSHRHDYFPTADYFPGQSVLPINAGQFLYPSAYGYALPDRNEYTAAVNPYFPGLAYSQFAYPIVYYYSAPPPAASNPPRPDAGRVTEPSGDETTTESSPPPRAPTPSARPLPNEPNSVLEAVQLELARRGYYTGEPDGLPGPATAEAIRRFQTDLRLRPTGRVNQATLFALGLN